jgi:hypothetical protein
MQQFTETQCCECGIAFKLPSAFFNQKRRFGGDFWCPNGHSLSFKQSDIKQLQDELEKAREELRLRREADH